MLEYFTPNFQCGLGGGILTILESGVPVNNTHAEGSGMGKVVREIVMVRSRPGEGMGFAKR